MVNNSTNTNLNQTNNDLSSQLIEHNKRPEMVLRNPGPGLGQAQTCGGVKLVIIGSQPLPLLTTTDFVDNSIYREIEN